MKNSHQTSKWGWAGGMFVVLAMSLLPRGIQAQEFGAPTGVTVKSGPEQLTVEWDEVEGATGYKVQWRNAKEEGGEVVESWDAERQAMVPETKTNHTISSGLKATDSYQVRVFAKDMYGDYSHPSDDPVGDGAPTDPHPSTGMPAPGKVGTPTVTAGSENLRVEWDKVDGATSYKVQWRDPVESPSWGKDDFTVSEDDPATDAVATDNQRTVAIISPATAPATNYTISVGLSAETTYAIRVIALNGPTTAGDASTGGEGTASDDATGRPAPGQVSGPEDSDPADDAPDPVKVEADEGKLKVSWLKVEGADKYKVQWKSGTQDWDPSGRQAMVNHPTTKVEIPSLTAGTVYSVRVFANNGDDTDASDGGDGLASPIGMNTPKPGQVVIRSVTPGEEELTVDWDAVSGTAAGIAYKVQWRDPDESPSWAAADFTATETDPADPGDNQETVSSGTIYTISLPYSTTTVDKGIEYAVRVIATSATDDLDGDGTADDAGGGDGKASEDATGTPQPGQVTELVRVTGDNEPGELTVEWTQVSGADGYTVQWKAATELNYDQTRQFPGTSEDFPLDDSSPPKHTHRISGLGSTPHTVQVFARNDGGKGTAGETGSLTPGTPGSNQVTGVRVMSGKKQLMVSWDEVDGASGYKVQWREGAPTASGDTPANFSPDNQISTTSTRQTISSGLKANLQYTVKVTATVSGAVSSPETGGWTLPDKVTGPVGVSTFKTDGTTALPAGQLRVTWTPLVDTETDNTEDGYKVQWRTTGSEAWSELDVDGLATATATIGVGNADSDNPPLSGTLYRVRVIAYNAGGDGDPSAEATGTPTSAAVTTAPTVASGPEQLKVSWGAVAGAARYKVQWWKDATETTFPASFVPAEGTNQKTVPTGTSYTIPLTGGARHLVRVIAVNASDVGGTPPSVATAGTPAPGKAGTPTVTAGSENLRVEWGQVAGATSYKVQWRDPDESPSWAAADFTATEDGNQKTVTATNYTIPEGLTNVELSAETTYVIRVIASNGPDGGGDGAGSNDATGRPAPGQVSGPDDTDSDPTTADPVKVEALEGKLKVSWLKVEGADKYKVQWKSGTQDWDPSGRQAMVNHPTTRYEIPGRTAGTVYSVRVFANNGVDSDASDGGDGSASPIGMNTPKPGKVVIRSVTSGEQELTVDWDAVSGTAAGISYKVQWRNPATVTSWSRLAAAITATTAGAGEQTVSSGTIHTIPLAYAAGDKGIEYAVRVIATSATDDLNDDGTTDDAGGGDGPASDDATGTPQPGQVTNVSATSGDIWATTVTWNRLDGADKYFVQWKKATEGNYDQTRQEEIDQPETGNLTHRISELEADIAYTVQVRAYNDGGRGTAGSPVIGAGTPFTPVGSTGNQVVGVMVTSGSKELEVEWDAVPKATGYKVQWRTTTGGTYDDLTDDAADTRTATPTSATPSRVTGTSYTITGLTPGTGYSVRVIAIVAAKDGTASHTDDGGATGTPAPGQVENLQVILVDQGALNLSWTQTPGAPGAIDYIVQWRAKGQEYSTRSRMKTGIITTTATLSEMDLRGPGLLMPSGQQYYVQVIARNGVDTDPSDGGKGPPSEEATGTPLPDRVTGVEVTRGPHQLEVEWEAVPGATGYAVQWKSGGQGYDNVGDSDDAGDTRTERLEGDASSHTIESLTAGTEYTVQVRASNDGGFGPASDQVEGIPATGPVEGPLTVTARSKALMVSWTPVAGADGYKIQWKSGSEEYDPATREGRSSTPSHSHTIGGLDAGTEYTVQVIATLEVGSNNDPEKDDSTPSASATGTPAPDKVGTVTVTEGAKKLLLSWAEVDGADGYKVQWKSGDQDWDPATRQASGSDITGTKYTIEDLTADPATEYTVRVIAYNGDDSDASDGGDGTPSDEVTGTPKEPAADQVAKVTVTSIGGGLTVSWTAVTTTPAPTGYKVQWRDPEEEASWDEDDFTPTEGTNQKTVTATRHTIEGLTADTEYTVRVIAVLTSGDDGTPSDDAFGVPMDRPGLVTGLTVTSDGFSTVTSDGSEREEAFFTVSWDQVQGEVYRVQVLTGGDTDFSVLPDDDRELIDGASGQWSFPGQDVVGGIRVRIRAENDAGAGEWSAPETAYPTLDQVDPVTVSRGAGRLTVSWAKVLGATGYKVEWRTGTQAFKERSVTAPTRQHAITGLTAGTEYTVRVTATLNGIEGTPSALATGTPTTVTRRPSTPSTPTPQPPTTPPTTPTTPPVTTAPRDPKPGKVVLSSVRAGKEGGQLAVKWRVMGKTTGYKVQWKSGDQDFSSSRQARVSGMLAVNHVIGDLDYTIEYMVRVIAYNSHGDGPASDSRTGTPKRGVPKNNLAIEDPDEARTVGQAISLTVSVAEEGAHVLEVTGGRGVTLSGDGVTDQGGGSAQLDADSWSEGQRTVVLNDTVGPDVLSIVLRNTDGDSLAGLSGIMYNPGEASQLVVIGLPDTLAVGRAYRGQVSATDSYGNVRTEDREVTISTDARNVSSSSPVELEEGTGGFWVRSDEVPATALVLTFEDSEDSDLSSSVSVTVRPLDAPDRVVAADNPGDEGGFVLLTWDLSDDHSILDTYRIFRGEGSAREWGSVAAAPGATEGRAVVATLDTMSSVWGVRGQIGGSSMMDDMACMADIVVTGSDVDGLEVLVWRTGSGNRVSSPRSSNILWKGTTDATGQVSLSVNNSGRTSSYAATARRDGELVASWRGIQLTPSDCPSLELAIGGEATVGGATDQRPSVVLMSSITQSGSARALDNTPPAAAGSFRAVDVPDDDGGQIQLSWTESTSDVSITRSVEGAVGPVTSDMSRGVVGYRIYRETAEGFALLGTVGPGVTGFVDTTAITGIRFTYVVSAFDQDNETVSEEESAMSIRNREEDVNGKLIQGLFGADKTVGFDDYFHFADHYGSSVEDTEWEPAFDLAAKQAVNIDGYNVFAENFGRQTASAAKVIPLEPGRNEQTRLDFIGGVPLPRVGEEFVLTLHLSDFGLLKGYGFQVEFDGEELEVVRAVAADNGLGEGTLANPQVLAVAEGKQAIVAYGDEVSEGTVAVELVFRALREFEDGWIRITEGQVRDGAFAVNPLVLPAPVQMETLPEVYALGFNYPNPFNPETTIKYALPQASDVELVIYNSLGQVVRTLVNERQGVGRYAFTWDATNDRGQAVSSGIYLYRLQAGEFAKVRKMLLLK